MADKWDQFAQAQQSPSDKWDQYAIPESAASVPPHDPGFWNTIGHDLMEAPTKLMETLTGHPLDAVRQATQARIDQRPLAVDAWKRGDYSSAFGHALASVLPFVGPAAAQAGEEIGGGQTGQGMAHALETAAPFIPGAGGSELASAAETPLAVAKGAIKGGVKEAASPVTYGMHRLPVPKAVAGAMAGRFAGETLGPTGAKVGGLIGGAAPFVQGAVSGGKAALADARAAKLAVPDAPPIWQNVPEPTRPIPPDVSPIPSQLPSGRVPGQPQPAPAPPPRVSLPSQAGAAAVPPNVPEFSSLPGSLPSGRVPGQPKTVAQQLGQKVAASQPQTGGPSAPPGSVIVPPTEGTPSRYGDVGSKFGTKMAADAYAKDQAIAGYLQNLKLTPDQFDSATPEMLNSWAKAANPKYKGVNPDRIGDLRALLFPE